MFFSCFLEALFLACFNFLFVSFFYFFIHLSRSAKPPLFFFRQLRPGVAGRPGGGWPNKDSCSYGYDGYAGVHWGFYQPCER